jgi:hypothetical protein
LDERPSLVGTYDASITADIFGEGITYAVGTFVISQHTGGGRSGGIRGEARDREVPSYSENGLVVGKVGRLRDVVLTLRFDGYTSTRFEGLWSSTGDISGIWGPDDHPPLERQGMFLLRRLDRVDEAISLHRYWQCAHTRILSVG